MGRQGFSWGDKATQVATRQISGDLGHQKSALSPPGLPTHPLIDPPPIKQAAHPGGKYPTRGTAQGEIFPEAPAVVDPHPISIRVCPGQCRPSPASQVFTLSKGLF
jgi:hypothetical protein